ncbi:MAG: glycosyltransferase family 2 protein [Patescibacteria group bacterium]
MNKLKELSVFFPIYNEEKNIRTTFAKTLAVLPTVAEKFEILLVNDGSSDRTGKVLEELAAGNPLVRVITHPVNRGYGAALKSGLYGAAYEWVAFTDSDGQFDFSEITRFIETQAKTGADMVIGYYLHRAVPFYRKVNSFLWQFTVLLFFGLSVRDIDCGFKLFRKKVIETIPPLESERGAFISTEFLIKAKKSGFKMVEIGVHHYPATRPGTGANLNVILKSFSDLFKLRRRL